MGSRHEVEGLPNPTTGPGLVPLMAETIVPVLDRCNYILSLCVVVKQHTYSVAGAAILDPWGFSFAATVVFVAPPPAPFEFCKFFQPAGDNTPPTLEQRAHNCSCTTGCEKYTGQQDWCRGPQRIYLVSVLTLLLAVSYMYPSTLRA